MLHIIHLVHLVQHSRLIIHRRANIFFNIISPTPGTFIIALHFKGRDRPILEMDLKLDDLLEKVSSTLLFVAWHADASS